MFGESNQPLETFSAGTPYNDFSYDDSLLYEYFFTSDKSTQEYFRSYQKLQDLLAVLGGISSTYLLLTGILISNYRRFLLIFDVFGHLFEIPKTGDSSQRKDENKTKKKKKQKLNFHFIKKPAKESKLSQSPQRNSKPEVNLAQNSQTFASNSKFPEATNDFQSSIKVSISIEKPNEPKKELRPQTPTFEMKTQKPLATQMPFKEIKSHELAKEEIGGKIGASHKIFLTPIPLKKLRSDGSLRSFHEEENQKGRQTALSPLSVRNLPLVKEKIEKSSKPARISQSSANVRYWEFAKFRLKKIFGFKLTAKEAYIGQATIKFEEEMDALKILQKLKELEKLKFIIFDPLQQKMFELYAKQKISLDRNDCLTEFEINDDLLRERKQSIKKGKLSIDFDQRLLNNLGKSQ